MRAGVADDPAKRRLGWRRRVFAALVATTIVAIALFMARLLGSDGLDVIDLLLLALFTVTLPWVVMGLWNSLIGFAILLLARDPAACVMPALARTDPKEPLRSRTAIAMPVYNEEPEQVFRHLGATLLSLEATGEADRFEAFLLSDTRDTGIAKTELLGVEALRAGLAAPERLHYRRRADNAGYKTGNLWDFLRRHGDRFDLMLVIDADSLMSGEAIVQLAHVMEQNPEIGILQQLIAGLPNPSPFPRLFQIGVRRGMRTYNLGAAWWQGDCGPYWGHNAMIRVAPFVAHCRLPDLPSRPPFGGRILSHDQVEAVLMRRAGHEVRLLALEDGSWELTPPTVIEFMKRDFRWCQGNLQYLNLVRRGDMHMIGRIQLLLAILMYANAPAWLTFALIAFGRALITDPPLAPQAASLLATPSPAEPWLMLVILLTLAFAPKLMGTLVVLVRRREAAAHGGRARVLATALVELTFSIVLYPLMLSAQAFFVLAMIAGRTSTWGALPRSHRTVRWIEALRSLWPQVAAGSALVIFSPLMTPQANPWALLLGGVLLAGVPFAVLTALPALGEILVRSRLAAMPDELASRPEIIAVTESSSRDKRRQLQGFRSYEG